MKSQAELLRQLQNENLALVAENLRLRAERAKQRERIACLLKVIKKVKGAFARYVNWQFVKSKHGNQRKSPD